jgi:hypothetical protein
MAFWGANITILLKKIKLKGMLCSKFPIYGKRKLPKNHHN